MGRLVLSLLFFIICKTSFSQTPVGYENLIYWRSKAYLYTRNDNLYDELVRRVDLVEVAKYQHFPLFGQFCPESRSIIISEFTQCDVNIFNVTMFHEIGHVFGLPHTSNPNDIMCGDPPRTFSDYGNIWYIKYVYANYFATLEYYIKNPHLAQKFSDCNWKKNY